MAARATLPSILKTTVLTARFELLMDWIDTGLAKVGIILLQMELMESALFLVITIINNK